MFFARRFASLLASAAALAACSGGTEPVASSDAGFTDVAPGQCVPPARAANRCTKSLDEVCDATCIRDWAHARDANAWCAISSAHDVTILDTPQHGLRAIVLGSHRRPASRAAPMSAKSTAAILLVRCGSSSFPARCPMNTAIAATAQSAAVEPPKTMYGA